MSRKTVYYHDPLHDDFAPTNGRIHPKQIGADFPYEHKGPLWNALAFVVYRMVMTPFLFLYCKLVFGLRIENRKALRALPGGYFLYGNHTNTLADAFIPTLLAFPRRANIITSADTVSIPGVRNIVQMLGAIPLADTIEGTRQFLAAMHCRLERGQAVMIYPEAHIWPYYNGIRPFPDTSFAYPVREQLPVVAAAVVYRKRKLLPVLAAVSLMLAGLSGCGGHAEPPLEAAAYSNLTDAVSRGLLSESLADSGISENRVSILLDRVDQFNARVKNEWLTEGFESGALTDTKYDPYEMQELWTEKNGSFPGYNCRITAFSLFGAFVTAGADQPETQGEDTLFLDLETLAADPAVLCGDSTSKFCALFAPVAAADSTETAEQVKALRAGWAERGVAFEEGTARLISVVLHDRFSDTDNTLFIGHVGVLLPAGDGSLYFVEKVAFQEPYRLLRFADRTELSDYLMGKYDVSWGQSTARPFIMENDELMEGWRSNPDSADAADH